jgi:hypothetical protein
MRFFLSESIVRIWKKSEPQRAMAWRVRLRRKDTRADVTCDVVFPREGLAPFRGRPRFSLSPVRRDIDEETPGAFEHGMMAASH